MTHLWGLLWRFLVSAVIVVIVLLAMLLLTACAKPTPLSPPIATPTAVVPDKGIIGPEWQPISERSTANEHRVLAGIRSRMGGSGSGTASELVVPNEHQQIDSLTTHRIFVGRDGPVLISRDIAPDPNFWAGVGVAGCESAWRAAVDSSTNDRGFWQLNRIHEGRFLRRGWTWEDAKDAEKNTEIAFEIFLEQGWQPWATRNCVGKSMGTSGDY